MYKLITTSGLLFAIVILCGKTGWTDNVDNTGLSSNFADSEDPISSAILSATFASKFRFSGTSGQFAKFPAWLDARLPDADSSVTPSAGRATLSFEFRTENPNAFLVYLDDGGSFSYIAVTLVNGELHLRFKFGRPKTIMLRSGSHLNDKRWHEVVIERHFSSVILTLDGEPMNGTVVGDGRELFVPRTYTFFGGLKRTYRVQTLSLPGIYYRKRFIGDIRRISMNGNYVTYLEKSGVHEEAADQPCSAYRNPCQNNGKCFVVNKHPSCDCSYTNFTGNFCEELYDDAVAMFRGSEWFSYSVRNQHLASYIDQIQLSFKTRQPNGMILHTGMSADFVTLALRDGCVLLVINLGSGAYEVVVEPKSGTFSDGNWHSISVNRTLRQVDILVDQANLNSQILQDDYTQLTLNDVIYVGGSPSSANLPGLKIRNNYIGCLKEVSYSGISRESNVWLPLSRWARDDAPGLDVHGNVAFVCSDPETKGPVTFKDPQSFLTASSWTSTLKGSIAFSFRTTERHGLLIYANSTASDLYAVEIYDGNLYVVVNLGSGTSRFLSNSSRNFADGEWHPITVNRNGKDLTVTVHGASTDFLITGPNRRLDLSGPIYVGGANFPKLFRPAAGLWTAPLRQGFVGCLKDLRVDDVNVELQSLIKSNDVTSSGTIEPFCGNMVDNLCRSSPCKNGALCMGGMGRFICDCSNTSYSGQTCEQAVVVSSFDGSQAMTFPIAKTTQTEADEILLRFKTSISTGMLFATTSNSSKDSIKVQLVNGGRVRLSINVDCSQKNCTSPSNGPDELLRGKNLNDQKWHRVKVSRRGPRVTLDVDGSRIAKSLPGKYSKLEFDVIHLGKILKFSKTNLTTRNNAEANPFVGFLENVIFNSVQLIDRCASGTVYCNNTSTMGSNERVVAFPITFEEQNSFVELPTLNAYNSMYLYLSLKTTVSDGLIFYNGGKRGDFIALEIVDGVIYYIFDLGNGAQVMSVPGSQPVNDNEWHDVKLTRDETNLHTMIIDAAKTYRRGSSSRTNLDLNGNLYVGGVSQNLFNSARFPNRITSRQGFKGCLGNLDFNGRTLDLLGPSLRSTTGSISGGCRSPDKLCRSDSCMNGGVCIHQWNRYICDCSLTLFIGENCEQHVSALIPAARTYRFGPNKGSMSYRWVETYPSPREDTISLGFSTSQRNALLMRVTGTAINGYQDFLEIKLEEGRLKLKFNIGSRDVVVVEPRTVADGQYHTCVVRRKWMNATMRVDNRPEQKNFTNEWTNSVFSSQNLIQIGGIADQSRASNPASSRMMRKSPIRYPFRGQMAGFDFNGIRVFELAERENSPVEMIGDVKLIGVPRSVPFPTPTIYRATTTMATVTFSTTTKTTEEVNGPIDGCDDIELCNTGSGSGSLLSDDDDEEDLGSGVIPFVPVSRSRTTAITTVERNIKPTENSASLDDISKSVAFSDALAFSTQATSSSMEESNFDFGKYFDEPSEKVFDDLSDSSLSSFVTNKQTERPIVTDVKETSDTLDRELEEAFLFFAQDIIDDENPVENTKEKSPGGELASNTKGSSSTTQHGDEEVTWQTTINLMRSSQTISTPAANDSPARRSEGQKRILTEKSTMSPVFKNGQRSFMDKQKSPPENEYLPTYHRQLIAASKLTEYQNDVTSSSPLHTSNKNHIVRDSTYSVTDVATKSHVTSSTRVSSTVIHDGVSPAKHNERVLISASDQPLSHTSARVVRTQTNSKETVGVNDSELSSTSMESNSKNSKLKSSTLVAPISEKVTPATAVLSGSLPSVIPQNPFSTLLTSLSNNISTNVSYVFGDTDSTLNVTILGKGVDKEWGSSIVADTKPEQRTFKANSTVSSIPTSATLTKNITEAVPVVMSDTLSLSTAMVAGLAAAAAACVLLIIFVIYQYRRKWFRSSDYNVEDQERKQGLPTTNGKHMYVQANGEIVKSKSNLPNHKADKEVYV